VVTRMQGERRIIGSFSSPTRLGQRGFSQPNASFPHPLRGRAVRLAGVELLSSGGESRAWLVWSVGPCCRVLGLWRIQPVGA
jgi:hypothetical protein